MNIVFMGTSSFSSVILESLINQQHNIIATYSQPPSRSGRGMKSSLSPVHDLALRYNISAFTPKSLKDEKVQQDFMLLKADVVVVASYGLILPKWLINNFRCINVHASILPRWRGAAPIERCIEAGDKFTGVTIIEMDEGLDTGKMLLKEKVDILPNMNNGILYDLLSKIGSNLIIEALDKLVSSSLEYEEQDNNFATYAHKLRKEERYLDCFSLNTIEVDYKIRAFSPNPSVYIILNKEKIKILEADYILHNHNYSVGSIVNDSFNIALKDGILLPKLLQRPGKKAMKLLDMLNGYKFTVGSLLDKEDFL